MVCYPPLAEGREKEAREWGDGNEKRRKEKKEGKLHCGTRDLRL